MNLFRFNIDTGISSSSTVSFPVTAPDLVAACELVRKRKPFDYNRIKSVECMGNLWLESRPEQEEVT